MSQNVPLHGSGMLASDERGLAGLLALIPNAVRRDRSPDNPDIREEIKLIAGKRGHEATKGPPTCAGITNADARSSATWRALAWIFVPYVWRLNFSSLSSGVWR